MHRGVQTTKGTCRQQLLIAVAMLGLLFMPVEYRAGAEHPHAHSLLQLFAEATHSAPQHHQAPHHAHEHQAEDQGDRPDGVGHQLEARSMTSSDGAMFRLRVSTSSPGQSPASQAFDVPWTRTTLPTMSPLASLMTIEVPDVPETMDLTPAVVTHTATLTGVLIVAIALLLVRRMLVLTNPCTLTGRLPQPEPPPPRLLTMLYT